MSHEYFIEIAKYNQWANQKFIVWLQTLNEKQWSQSLVSSFMSIADTVLHIVGAEQVWHDRLIKVENPIWLPSNFKGGKAEALDAWNQSSKLLVDYTQSLSNESLDQIIPYKRINGEALSQPVFEILAHVFNHSTYHRGQLVTMLRQVGFEDVSSTDLALFYRDKNKII